MKYLILMTSLDGAWEALTEAEQADVVARHETFSKRLESEGRLVFSCRLGDAARTVRKDSAGGIELVDGPYAGKDERVGGLYVIEADSMDEACRWAEDCRFIAGSNEVRPFFG